MTLILGARKYSQKTKEGRSGEEISEEIKKIYIVVLRVRVRCNFPAEGNKREGEGRGGKEGRRAVLGKEVGREGKKRGKGGRSLMNGGVKL